MGLISRVSSRTYRNVMFKRRLSRLRTASFVIFVASVVYFLEALLRHILIASPGNIKYELHKNSRILLARLTRDFSAKSSSDDQPSCKYTIPDIENVVVDNSGGICDVSGLDKHSSCCKNETKVAYERCQCCSSHNLCVVNCINHPKTYPDARYLNEGLSDSRVDSFFKNLPISFLKYSEFSTQIWNQLELCKAVCRTNSGSVKDGN